jgi:hypothetical protein
MGDICKTSSGAEGPGGGKPFGACRAIGYRGSLHGIDGDSCR